MTTTIMWGMSHISDTIAVKCIELDYYSEYFKPSFTIRIINKNNNGADTMCGNFFPDI